MADNIVKLLEDRLRERPMKTMDPNTQAAGDEAAQSPRSLYHRAIISAALAGLLEYSRQDRQVESLLAGRIHENYAETIFSGHFKALEQKIRTYSGYPGGNTKEDFNFVLQQSVNIIAAQTAGDPQKVKDYISGQRANILSYLPGALHTGKLLKNGTIDDRTHKMHGPFSDFTHWMEEIFSTADE